MPVRSRRLGLWLLASLLTAVIATAAYQWWRGELQIPDISLDQLTSLEIFLLEDEAEEPLLVYSAMRENQIEEYIAAFRTEHPDVEIEYELFDTVDLIRQVLAEKNDPQADVIWGVSATGIQALVWREALTPYAPKKLELLPLDFRDQNTPPMWVGQNAQISIFCVNEDVLKTAGLETPKSWADLFHPKYGDSKDKEDAGERKMIVFPSPEASNIGYMNLFALIDLYGETNLWEELHTLHTNVATYDLGPDEACNAVGRGEHAIAISYDLAGVTERLSGAPITIVFPEDKLGWDIQASAIVRKSPTHPSAELLLDYIISEDAMHQYGQHYTVTAIPIEYLPVPTGFPEKLAKLPEKDFLWAGANRARLTIDWAAYYQEWLLADKVLEDELENR